MGGSKKVTIGYSYFMKFHMVLCHTPSNGSFNRVFVGDRQVDGISAPVTTNQTVVLNSPNLFGGVKKEGGIYGNLDIMFGEDDQTQNPSLIQTFGNLVPAYRGVLSLVFRQGPEDPVAPRSGSSGGYVCSMSAYPKPWSFEITDIPGKLFSPSTQAINPEDDNGVNIASANGAHIIYECITDPEWGLGLTDNDIDLDSFGGAAQTLFDEGFGLSMAFFNQASIESFINEVLTHINASLYSNRSDGKFALKLIRDDYDEGTLSVFNETNIVRFQSFERPAFAEMVNEVTINYKPRRAIQESSITMQDISSVQAQGGIITKTLSFLGIDSNDIASKVGIRELKQSSTPLARAKIIVNREGWAINPGDVIKLSWGNYGIEQLIMRVLEVDYGTLEDGNIRFSLVEDIFGLPDNSYFTPVETGWVEEVDNPVAAASSIAIEVPYFDIQTTFDAAVTATLDDTDCFIQVVNEVDSNATFGIDLYTRISPEDYQEASEGVPTPTCTLAAALDRQQKIDISVANFKGGVDSVVIGSYAYLNDEVLRIDSVDVVNSLVSVGRGYLDTIPQSHPIDSIIYFADGNDVRDDETSYSTGTTLNAKALTQTGLGLLDLASAPELTLNFVGRQSKPYNAAQVQINGQYFPASLTDEVAIAVTWTHQDRTQQLVEGGQDWFEVGLGAQESGVTYTVEYYNNSNDVLLFSESDITGTASYFTPDIAVDASIDIRIELKSIRNSEESFVTFAHVVNYTKPLVVVFTEDLVDAFTTEDLADRIITE